jgi:hypothetical protein
MIAMLAGLRFGAGTRRTPHIWIPLPLLYLLFLPLAIVLLPFALVACLIFEVPFLRTLSILWGIAGALRGTHIEVDAPDLLILITLH